MRTVQSSHPPKSSSVFRDIGHDLTYAVRLLRRSPGVVAVTVLGLGLAIGVSTAVFSLLNAVAFRPTGIDDPASAVRVMRAYRNGIGNAWRYADYLLLRDGARACATRSVASRWCVDQHETRYRRRRHRKPAVRERRLPFRIEQSDFPRTGPDGGRRCAGRSAGCGGELCVVVTQAGRGDHHHRPADLVEWHAVHRRGREPAWLQRYAGHAAGGLGTVRELSHRVRRPAARPAFIDDREHHRPSHERLLECPGRSGAQRCRREQRRRPAGARGRRGIFCGASGRARSGARSG